MTCVGYRTFVNSTRMRSFQYVKYERNFNAINVGRALEVWVMGGIDVFTNEREMFYVTRETPMTLTGQTCPCFEKMEILREWFGLVLDKWINIVDAVHYSSEE